MTLILLKNFRLRGAGYDDPNNSNTYEYRDLYGVVGVENLVKPKHSGFGSTLHSSLREERVKCKTGRGLKILMGLLGGRVGFILPNTAVHAAKGCRRWISD